MKKILAVLLATSSIAAFAETFQDFNNNAYLQYNNTSINLGQGNTVGYTLGTTIQAKNNVWINAEAYGSPYNSNTWPGALNTTTPASTLGGSTYGQFLATAKAGYAFQFFGDEASGFQVIPYATYTYGTSLGALNQYYGLGVKPEYRFLNALKVSVDMTAYNATQAGGGAIPASVNPTFNSSGWNNTDISDFRYTLNPEVQYDIAKTILVAGGYKYDQSFNNQSYDAGNNTVYVRVGYLF
jgi:hypothetical protein